AARRGRVTGRGRLVPGSGAGLRRRQAAGDARSGPGLAVNSSQALEDAAPLPDLVVVDVSEVGLVGRADGLRGGFQLGGDVFVHVGSSRFRFCVESMEPLAAETAFGGSCE